MLRNLKAGLLLVVLFIIAQDVFAQRTAIYTDEDRALKQGLELFSKEKYGSAQKKFYEYLRDPRTDRNCDLATDASYYLAVCSFELFNDDAEKLLTDFIELHPESPRSRFVKFYLGNLFYRKKKFKDAIAWYERVDKYDLENTRLAEFYFKLGYSYFQVSDFEKAKTAFFEIKDVDSKYAAPAKYYYAHIAYNAKNYETSLQDFQKLTNDEAFGPIVPYYIAQILFLQGKYENVVAYAPPLLDSANTKRAPEIARLIGESYYKLNKYNEAIPFLEQYKEKSKGFTREDNYQLGFAYYKAGKCDKAVSLLEKATLEDDSLAQNAYYHIADCYLIAGKKRNARNAFQNAARIGLDKVIREDAMFNFAKLSFELAFNPYNEAIQAFENYLKEYPDSPRADEANKYLVNVYLTTRNYRNALASIEKIKNKNENLLYAYQKIAYFRGVELFNNKEFNSAVTHFDKALSIPKEKKYNVLAHYWKGEALYKQGLFDLAVKSYEAFVFEPGAVLTPYFNTVNYNLGYVHFKRKQYSDAITWFRKYTGNKDEQDQKRLNDAYTRIGDSYFIKRDFSNASDYYGQALQYKSSGNDYVAFQKAVADGIQGKAEGKISSLQTLLSENPSSAYSDDAKFELGNTYMVRGENEKALEYFNKLISEHKNSSYVPKALTKIGLVYFNSDKNKEALEIYKRVLAEYPNTQQAREAINQVRNIYVEMGEGSGFSDYVKTLPGVNISNATLDSTTYEAAEKKYMKGDCSASRDFADYLKNYPTGFFLLNANFYKAECDFQNGVMDEALKGYSYVVSQPKNAFSEKSIARTAQIHVKNKNHEGALSAYQKLREQAEIPENLMSARIGIMRAAYQVNRKDEAAAAAKELLTMEKTPAELAQEAHLIIGKVAMDAGNDSLAKDEFMVVAKGGKSVMAAEAKYNIAYLQYKKGAYKESEKSCFELINQVPSFDYWIAKSIILLADNYVGMKDLFQAKASLQSIIDNYEGEDLKKVAKDKLDLIIAEEQKGMQKGTEAAPELEFKGSNPSDDKLFEEKKKDDNTKENNDAQDKP